MKLIFGDHDYRLQDEDALARHAESGTHGIMVTGADLRFVQRQGRRELYRLYLRQNALAMIDNLSDDQLKELGDINRLIDDAESQ